MNMIVVGTTYTVLLIAAISKFIFFAQGIAIVKIISSIVIVFLFINLFKKHVYKKIDGVTGDILGCTIELSEVLYLVYMYLLIR